MVRLDGVRSLNRPRDMGGPRAVAGVRGTGQAGKRNLCTEQSTAWPSEMHCLQARAATGGTGRTSLVRTARQRAGSESSRFGYPSRGCVNSNRDGHRAALPGPLARRPAARNRARAKKLGMYVCSPYLPAAPAWRLERRLRIYCRVTAAISPSDMVAAELGGAGHLGNFFKANQLYQPSGGAANCYHALDEQRCLRSAPNRRPTDRG